LQESRSFLVDIADRASLDLEKFNECLKNSNSQILNSNISEGEALGISGAPTVYINGQQFTNYFSYEDLERLVKVVIAK